eukprot:CAMPEP_0197848856 /NCGR_PEP_ID=MMETSP1438-20131217/10255_1 /TAXON_ID=1461541 /ORGANISM="Pterosperma sp., Strain CCMP1384" /LENGTH=50 /DNA_ID=CAMNT_0043461287 /DNA_START=177 /DNA_END=326 /DNA_ORIENTATION=-
MEVKVPAMIQYDLKISPREKSNRKDWNTQDNQPLICEGFAFGCHLALQYL